MPHKPAVYCKQPGCGELTHHYTRYCPVHRKALYKNDNRPSAHKRGYDIVWAKLSKRYLLDHPRCMHCGREAQCVDHIRPLFAGGDRLDTTNLQSLCTSCNAIKSRDDRRRYRQDKQPTPDIPDSGGVLFP